MSTSPTKVYVFPVPSHAQAIEELKKLIKDAGCELVCADSKPQDYAACVNDADVVAILLCPETFDDETVKKAVALAVQLGKRIVGVWAPGVEDETLPEWLKSYGDAAVVFGAAAAADSICGSKSVWESPKGQTRPVQKTPRHKGH